MKNILVPLLLLYFVVPGIVLADSPTGACCIDGGMDCSGNMTELDCDMNGGTWMGEGTDCGDYDEETGWSGCQNPPGACCVDGGLECYSDMTESDCDMNGGTWMGEGSECGEYDDETGWSGCQGDPTGACCVDGGMTCYDNLTHEECLNSYSGSWKGEGSTCGDYDDETGWSGCQGDPTGACCIYGGMDCSGNVTESDCDMNGGTWMGEGSTCGDYDEETGWSGCQEDPTGACCVDGGMDCYGDMTESDCDMNGGTWMGEGTECGDYDEETGWSGCQEDPTGACCVEGGMDCYGDMAESDCDMNGGTWMGEGSDCGDYDEETGWSGCQEDPTGACCVDGGMDCYGDMTEEDCAFNYGGDWMGESSTCGEYDEETGWSGCQQEYPTGACCVDGGMDCYDNMTESDCDMNYGGDWMGEGSECGEYDEETGYEGCQQGTSYNYLPGDANMAAETWPAQTIGGDVTYLVNYFRGISEACMLDGFYASADATGDCLVVGGDVTYLVNYFRGLADMSYCSDYEPAWPTPSDVPTDAPDGWPDCD